MEFVVNKNVLPTTLQLISHYNEFLFASKHRDKIIVFRTQVKSLVNLPKTLISYPKK